MTLGNDNGTDGQTDRRTDRVRRIMRPPPREEGRIIMMKTINYRKENEPYIRQVYKKHTFFVNVSLKWHCKISTDLLV